MASCLPRAKFACQADFEIMPKITIEPWLVLVEWGYRFRFTNAFAFCILQTSAGVFACSNIRRLCGFSANQFHRLEALLYISYQIYSGSKCAQKQKKESHEDSNTFPGRTQIYGALCGWISRQEPDDKARTLRRLGLIPRVNDWPPAVGFLPTGNAPRENGGKAATFGAVLYLPMWNTGANPRPVSYLLRVFNNFFGSGPTSKMV